MTFVISMYPYAHLPISMTSLSLYFEGETGALFVDALLKPVGTPLQYVTELIVPTRYPPLISEKK